MTEELTPRQGQVRDLVTHGLMDKEIAARLGISHRTVEEHKAEVLRKYEVRNAVELVRKVYALEEAV